ncbi:MAG: S41 family peptidase, partial [Thermoanaerobaculia bacterium]|nr:S41 family peptidase [Thermoanaerobaculia bacterium]
LEVRPSPQAEWQPIVLENSGFETGVPSDTEDDSTDSDPGASKPIPGWGSGGSGYSCAATSESAAEGELSLVVASAPLAGPESLFEARPEAGETVQKMLARELWVQLPLALPSRDGRTLGPPDAPDFGELKARLASIDPNALDADDESLRLAGVILAWNVFQHFYPYFDVVDVDWDRVLTEGLRRALADAGGNEFLDTLRWVVSQLHDGHGFVAHPEAALRGGLPVALVSVDGKLVVEAVAGGNEGAGICVEPGDILESLDDESATERFEAECRLASGTLQWRTARTLRMFGRGEPGSRVRLGLRRGDETVHCEVERSSAAEAPSNRPEAIASLRPDVMYVDLGRAPLETIQERIEELAAAPGVVFDLRGYPRGNDEVLSHLSDQVLRSAHWQIPQQIYPDQERRVGFDTSGRWLKEPRQPRFRGEVVFLTDGRAISYAESVMGIVEHYQLGEIVGSATAGANGNVNSFTLPGGYRLTFTGMRVVKHDGSQHHLVGILPTVPAGPTLEGLRAGRDEVLEQGLALIEARLASGD